MTFRQHFPLKAPMMAQAARDLNLDGAEVVMKWDKKHGAWLVSTAHAKDCSCKECS